MTDTAAQRARFETSVVERLKESGLLEIEIRTECLVRCGDGYQDEVINAGWHYWQAALIKMTSSLDWYWPEDDTSSDACADGPWQIAENHDTEPGEVFGYSRGGVIETRYFGYLGPADDADSDDNFEVDEPTREAAEAKIAAELTRRAASVSSGASE